MSPIDYLRDMVKRGRKPATGGLVTADQAPMLTAGCAGIGYFVPTPSISSRIVYGNATVQINDDEPVPIASFNLELADAAWNDADLAADFCTCNMVIYSRCYCHLRKRTVHYS